MKLRFLIAQIILPVFLVMIAQTMQKSSFSLVKRHYKGDLFMINENNNNSNCNDTVCNENGRQAVTVPWKSCYCQCLPSNPTFRPDSGLCVDQLHECQLLPFQSPLASENIPLVSIPTPAGKLVHPNAEIILNTVDFPGSMCHVFAEKYLSPDGWQNLSSLTRTNLTFQLVQDSKNIFMQFNGDDNGRSKMDGQIIVVELSCKTKNDANIVPRPCASFRITGTIGTVTAKNPATNEQPTSGRWRDWIIIGFGVGLLGVTYILAILIYLAVQKRHERKMANAPVTEVATTASEADTCDSNNSQYTNCLPFGEHNGITCSDSPSNIDCSGRRVLSDDVTNAEQMPYHFLSQLRSAWTAATNRLWSGCVQFFPSLFAIPAETSSTCGGSLEVSDESRPSHEELESIASNANASGQPTTYPPNPETSQRNFTSGAIIGESNQSAPNDELPLVSCLQGEFSQKLDKTNALRLEAGNIVPAVPEVHKTLLATKTFECDHHYTLTDSMKHSVMARPSGETQLHEPLSLAISTMTGQHHGTEYSEATLPGSCKSHAIHPKRNRSFRISRSDNAQVQQRHHLPESQNESRMKNVTLLVIGDNSDSKSGIALKQDLQCKRRLPCVGSLENLSRESVNHLPVTYQLKSNLETLDGRRKSVSFDPNDTIISNDHIRQTPRKATWDQPVLPASSELVQNTSPSKMTSFANLRFQSKAQLHLEQATVKDHQASHTSVVYIGRSGSNAADYGTRVTHRRLDDCTNQAPLTSILKRSKSNEYESLHLNSTKGHKPQAGSGWRTTNATCQLAAAVECGTAGSCQLEQSRMEHQRTFCILNRSGGPGHVPFRIPVKSLVESFNKNADGRQPSAGPFLQSEPSTKSRIELSALKDSSNEFHQNTNSKQLLQIVNEDSGYQSSDSERSSRILADTHHGVWHVANIQ